MATKSFMTTMLTRLTAATAILLVFPRLSLAVDGQRSNISSLNVAVTPASTACNCDCSVFPPVEKCRTQRLAPRSDCPCCQTCLRQAGELCDPVAFPCDEEFGLSCSGERNMCEGSYGLRTASASHNSLRMTWHRPVDHRGEMYIFYTQNYTTDLRQWSMQETTADSGDFIHGLQAATSYYVSLVPEWQGLFRFENRSEVLVARTEGCLNKNRSFAVGELFSDGCAYNCTCTKEGLLACVERKCPLVYKRGDIQDPLCKESPDPTSSDPCCVVYTCQHGHTPSALAIDSCVYKGRRHSLATEFYEDDCSASCYCDEIGVVECRPVKCPTANVAEADSALRLTSSSTSDSSNGSACLEWSVKQPSQGLVAPNCCPNITCINDGTCLSNGTRYPNGAAVPSGCDQHCLCTAGKVVCEPTCREPPVAPPLDPTCSAYILKRDGDNCCLEWKCDVRAARGGCFHSGIQFHIGDKWSDTERCRQRNCTCRQSATTGFPEEVCVGGCPGIRPEELVARAGCPKPFLYVPEDSCACPVVKCLSERADDSPLTEETIFGIRARALNSTSAEITLNISSSLPRTLNAVLETHITHVDTNPNASEHWQVSATKLLRIEPTITEFISGFEGNTTYRLRTRLILTDPTTGEDVFLPFSQSVMFTVPPKGPVCAVNETLFAEGAIVPQGCGQECVCRNGAVLCRPVLCEVQELVLLPSEFCPIPVLVKSPTDCCPRWECHPSSTGCRLGNAIYSHGDQWRNGCAEECNCRHGRIACRNLCEDLQRTVPHPTCRAVNVTGSCCPVWRCHEGAAVPIIDFNHETENAGMNLTVDSVTSTKALLTWVKPTDLKGVFGFNLVVEEAVSDRESFRAANLIHPDVQQFTLRDLSPGVRYKATLKAVEDGDRVVTSQSVHFQTLELSDLKITIWLGYIGNDNAEAVWDCIHCEDLKNLTLNLISSQNPGRGVGAVTPGLPKITLTELNPKENYQLWLQGTTSGGAVVKSNVLAFTTRATADFNEISRDFQNQTANHRPLAASTKEDQHLATALIIVATLAACFLFAFFIAVCYCLQYRRRATVQKTNPYQTYTDNMYK
ncbi:hypothetical protein BV898_06765 [Hypsibius exemplaris]|uniref:Epidermal cell surface receptor n=1 Tax=Hypsibius exemplaris TaxID=2072580 RepID=A0A1W0WVA0_HYPEX|nr:hypothetical protein BV898_06765 [Hypsibius exemplaris]